MNKHLKKLMTTFKGKDPMMIGILVVVLYLNVFHCNDFSKVLVTGILLWYFFNKIFNDFYVAAGFSILSVIIIELLQRRVYVKEGLEEEKKSEQKQKPEQEQEQVNKKEEKEEQEPEPDDALVDSISSIPESILATVDKKEEFSPQKQLSEFVNSIDQIQQMVNKLAPTVSRGMKVMEKIEKLGFV